MSPRDVETRPLGPEEVEGAIRAFTDVLEDLQAGHRSLEQRARRVEAALDVANAELGRKVAELEAILAALPTGVVVLDEDERVTRVNGAALDILGCEPASLVDRGDVRGLAGDSADGELRELERPDGRRLSITSRHSPVVLEGGDVIGSIEILDDRTEVVRMSERVHRLDKIAALGTMAGGIAHEIRNPMSAIRGFASLLSNEAEPDSKYAHWTGRICDGVDEVDAIITSMLTFADPERLLLETVAARELVDEAVDAVRRDLEHGSATGDFTITTEVEEVDLVADRIKLRQALRNLIANAATAQPEGGSAHISVSRSDTDTRIRVTDAGPGIPREIVHRVADPFFTTHADGTGLGLSLVHSIAQLHGGSFEVSAERAPLPLGGGADVLIRIPNPPPSNSR